MRNAILRNHLKLTLEQYNFTVSYFISTYFSEFTHVGKSDFTFFFYTWYFLYPSLISGSLTLVALPELAITCMEVFLEIIFALCYRLSGEGGGGVGEGKADLKQPRRYKRQKKNTQFYK